MSECYELFDNEKSYREDRIKALANVYDRLARSLAIHEFKRIYGSSLRKLLEVTGKKRGNILRGHAIKELLKPLGFEEEVVSFLVCIIEAYNDEAEYRQRKVEVSPGIRERTIKKRFNEYMKKGWLEFRKYQFLFAGVEEKRKYQDMKCALIFFNVMMKAFFTRNLPRRIPVALYDKCVECSDIIKLFYEREEEHAYLNKRGEGERKNFSGIYTLFGQEVALLFTLYFLHMIN